MIIKTIKVGELRTNCYIVASDRTKDAMIIDPGDDVEQIIDLVGREKFKPVIIINTHAHPDHIGANQEIAKKYDISAAVGEADYRMIDEWKGYFEEFSGLAIDSLAYDRLLKEGDKIKVGDLTFEVIETPGHSKGSICIYQKGVLFSGDTLFAGDYGRVDIPGGSEEAMNSSLKKILDLPEDTKVYPGHGYSTTIEKEKILYAAN